MFLLPYALVLLLSGAATIWIRRQKASVVKHWIDAPPTINDDPSSSTSLSSSLARARALQAPEVTSTTGGELEHLEFWNAHFRLIQNAWHEWEREISLAPKQEHRGKQIENGDQASSLDLLLLPSLNETTMMEPMLKETIQQLWKKPSEEAELDMRAQYWEEPIRNVYTCTSFFNPQGIRNLRKHLMLMGQSGIPTRRPNGMNRNGFVLDDETEGGVSYKSLDHFRSWLVDDYLRPLARMFFPEYIGSDEDDEVSYAFTVHYQYNDESEPTNNNGTAGATIANAEGATNVTTTRKKRDVQLKEHSDASVVTININLNLPEENEYEYDGSQLLFLDDSTTTTTATGNEANRHSLEFQPGMAVIHRGLHRHQALPIQKGERHQLIIWLFGKDGYVRIAPYEPKEQLSAKKRWSKAKIRKGDWDPFEL